MISETLWGRARSLCLVVAVAAVAIGCGSSNGAGSGDGGPDGRVSDSSADRSIPRDSSHPVTDTGTDTGHPRDASDAAATSDTGKTGDAVSSHDAASDGRADAPRDARTESSTHGAGDAAHDAARDGTTDGTADVSDARDGGGPADARLDAAALCTTYKVGTGPVGVVWDGAHAWVSNERSGDVYVVDPATGNVAGPYASGPGAQYMAFDGTYVWVANAAAGVTRFLATDATQSSDFSAGNGPDAVAYDGVHGTVWVTNTGDGSVTVLDATSGAFVANYPVGQHTANTVPRLITFDGTNMWTASLSEGIVEKFAASNGTSLGTFNLPGPYAITYDGTSIWVTLANTNQVAKMRPNDGTVLGTFPAGQLPNGVAANGQYVWVVDQVVENALGDASREVGTVTKLTADGGLVGTYDVGWRPQWAVWDGKYTWVTNGQDDTVSRCNF